MKAFDWSEFLRDTACFSALDEKTRQWLVGDEVSKEHRYEPGAVIVREGESGDSIFLIGAGSAEAILSLGVDRIIVLSVMQVGETFGEMAFFERRPRSATVRARDHCLVLEISGHGLRSLADTHPEVGLQILLRVSERLRSKSEQIFKLHVEALEAANRAKDQFVAMLGHELRNPLAAISAAIQVLNARRDDDANGAHLRGIITRQTQYLARLVDDLLDVSRLASGKVTLDRRPEDLLALAVRALTSFQEAGKATQHDIAITGRPVTVDGDPMRLEQIVMNLLDNAVKYTPPGGRVEITVGMDGPNAFLSVRDTGIGISENVLPMIFDLFVQGSQMTVRSASGLGLGLTIVKRLVELHAGAVSVSSPGPHQGSEFIVRLPRMADMEISAAAVGTEPQPTGPRHIVVIEDNADFRDGFRLLLESWGHRVEEAASGAEGLEILQRVRPDIVLVDLGLPDLDGYAVARAVRCAPGGDAIVMVAVTGYGTASDRRRSGDAGFDAHVTKPVNPQELATILRLTR